MEVVDLAKAVIFVRGRVIQEVDGFLALFRHEAEVKAFEVYHEDVWYGTSSLSDIIPDLEGGDWILTDSLLLFGKTQDEVSKTLVDLAVRTGLRIGLGGDGIDVVELTPAVVDILRRFGALDVKLVSNWAA